MDINNYHFPETLKEGEESIELLLPILKEAYPEADFKRFDSGGDVDREFSIDIKVIFPDRTETWAIKIRKTKFRSFNDITMEIMNGNNTKGDFYRFNGGIISKYLYGWRESNNLYDIHICNAKELANMPKHFWKGNLTEIFPGIGSVDCFQNEEYGKSWFTAISLNDIKKYSSVIEKILNEQFYPPWKLSLKNMDGLDAWL